MKRPFHLIFIIPAILAVLASGLALAHTPAGTPIINRATADYEDENGLIYKSVSNEVVVIVNQACGIVIAMDGTAANPGRTLSAMAGLYVAIPYTLRNPGNGADSYALTLENLTGDNADLTEARLIIDADRNGRYDPGEIAYNNGNPPTLAAGETLYLILVGKVPQDMAGESVLVNLSGHSLCNPNRTDVQNVSQINIEDNGFITAVKSADKSTFTPGDDITFRVDVTNPGTQPVMGDSTTLDIDGDGTPETVSGMTIRDELPDYLTLLPDSIEHDLPDRATPIFSGTNGNWTSDPDRIHGRIAGVGVFARADVDTNIVIDTYATAYFSFTVQTDPNTTPDAIENVASILYGDDEPQKTKTNPVTVTKRPPLLANIVVDDTDDGDAHTGSGEYPDPDDLMTTYGAPGQTEFQFVNEACNLSDRNDRINLSYDPQASFNTAYGVEVLFLSSSGDALGDADADGYYDIGPLGPGECRPFVTLAILPPDIEPDGVVLAILGTSDNDPAAADYTFNRIELAQTEFQIVVDDTDDDGAHTGSGQYPDEDDLMDQLVSSGGPSAVIVPFENEVCNFAESADTVNLIVDTERSININGLTWAFFNMNGLRLSDTDRDDGGLPDPGLLDPGQCRSFITQLTLPANQTVSEAVLAVKGISGNDPSAMDLTYNRVRAKGVVYAEKKADRNQVAAGGEIGFQIDFVNNGDAAAYGQTVEIDTNGDGRANNLSGMILRDDLQPYLTFLPGTTDQSPTRSGVFPVFAGEDGLWRKNVEWVSGPVRSVGLFLSVVADGVVMNPGDAGHFYFAVGTDPDTTPETIENVVTLSYLPPGGDIPIETRTHPVEVGVLPFGGVKIGVDDTDDEGAHSGSGVHTDPDDLMTEYMAGDQAFIDFVNEACNFGLDKDIVNLRFSPDDSVALGDDALTVTFLDPSGDPLPDADNDGVPDSGPLAVNECRDFITRVAPTDPAAVTEGFYVAVEGQSSDDPTKTDLTFDQVAPDAFMVIQKSVESPLKDGTVLPGEEIPYRLDFENNRPRPVRGIVVFVDKDNDGSIGDAEGVTGIIVYDPLPDHVALMPETITYSAGGLGTQLLYAETNGLWKTDPAQVAGRIDKLGLLIKADVQGNVFAAKQKGHIRFQVQVDAGAPPGDILNTGYVDYANAGGPRTAVSNEVVVEVLRTVALVTDDTDDEGARTPYDDGVPPGPNKAENIDPDDLMDMASARDGLWFSFQNEVCNLGNAADTLNIQFNPDVSLNMPEGLEVRFSSVEATDADGDGLPEDLLTDANGDGLPDVGEVEPDQCVPFLTWVFTPAGTRVLNLTVAVEGSSAADPTQTDHTFNLVRKIPDLLIKVEVRVKTSVQTEVQAEVEASAEATVETTSKARLERMALKNKDVVVYKYRTEGNAGRRRAARSGNQVEEKKIFATDGDGVLTYDENGDYISFYDWMEDGYEYRLTIAGEYFGYTYYLTPVFIKEDFGDRAWALGMNESYSPREDIVVWKIPPEPGNLLLVAPLEPAGYVYDGVTGEKVDGAIVTLRKCDGPDCETSRVVGTNGFDAYSSHGEATHENPQVTGTNNAGDIEKFMPGVFEFYFKPYDPTYDGWHYITVEFGDDYAAADPELKDRYEEVRLQADAAWEVNDFQPYTGQRFYIDKDADYTGAIHIPIPLMPAEYKPLKIEKTVDASVASIGDFVKFTLTATNPNTEDGLTIHAIDVHDFLPRELRYRSGSTRIDGQKAADPTITPDAVGLTWNIGVLDPEESVRITFLTLVGAGATEGRKVNTARAEGLSNPNPETAVRVESNIAEARFDISKGIFTDRGYIFGKVFVDDNDNRIQDENEQGVEDAKIYMEDGRYVVTDSEGKYHMDDIRPGTHVLKIDSASLPPGAVLKPIDSRNVGDPRTAFADVFPGDLFKVNFRLAPMDLKAALKSQYEEVTGKVTVRRYLETFLTDASSGEVNLKHTLVIENGSDQPLYEPAYEEVSPFVPMKGTAYINDGAFSDPVIEKEMFRWRLPLIRPGDTVRMTFSSQFPDKHDGAGGAFSFMVEAAGKESVSIPVDVPVALSKAGPTDYALTVYFDFAEYGLTDAAQTSLDALVAFLRKRKYDNLYIQVEGHTDSVRVRPERTDYTDNLELSMKRVGAVEQYLKKHLIEMGQVKPFDELAPSGVKNSKKANAYLEKIVGKGKPQKAEGKPQSETKQPLSAPATQSTQSTSSTQSTQPAAQPHALEIGRFSTHEALSKAKKKIAPQLPDNNAPIQIFSRKKLILGNHYDVLYVGPFDSAEAAEDFAVLRLNKPYPVRQLSAAQTVVSEPAGQPPVVERREAHGRMKPAVENRESLAGTPENRRVEVRVISARRKGAEAAVELGETLKRGLYRVEATVDNTYPLAQVYDAVLYIGLPDYLNYMNGSAMVNGAPAARVERKGQFFTVSAPVLKAGQSLKVALKFIAMKEAPLDDLSCVLAAKTQNGKTIHLISPDTDETAREAALGHYLKAEVAPTGTVDQSDVNALRQEVEFGIVHPADDVVQAAKNGNVRIVAPMKTPYELLLNGVPVPADRVGEESRDDKLGALTLDYVGLSYDQSDNLLELKAGDQTWERKIVISGDVERIGHSIYPEEPPADGKTPVYVTIELRDRKGAPVSENAYVSVRVDKGDIFDYEEDQYRSAGDGFQARVVAGKAVVRLSPSATTEERRLTVEFGNLEQDIDIRFYPEKRPWIVVGKMEGGIGFGDAKNNPPKDGDMPFDHSGGDTNMEGEASIFAKGSVKDYTVTLRYGTEKPDSENTLLKENTPGTEDDGKYPVYGDSSEQYFETQSKERLFLKVEKDRHYMMYGDYNTEMGDDMEFNRYSRTLNGGMVNLEKGKNFKVKAFASENRQSMVREDIPGRGISGPYFLQNRDLVENSEKVAIIVRDRYNDQMLLAEKSLNRYTDYYINYEDGWIIFMEAVTQFDDTLNPTFIRVLYESENLEKDHYIYGARGEKEFFDGKLKIGAMGVTEEHPEGDKHLYGADVVYDDGGRIKAKAEIVASENFENGDFGATSGEAGAASVAYKMGKNATVDAYYKKVTGGFQNMSATTPDTGYETYGAGAETGFFEDKTRVHADVTVNNTDTNERTTAEAHIDQELHEKLSVSVGTRWNREDPAGTEIDETVQANAGVHFKPWDRLGLSLTRDQSLSGETESTVYPTKTAGRVDVRITDNISAYLQSELQEKAEQDLSLTTLGLDSRIGENTTAFTKYAMDDSVSGWRNQAHVGLTHQFLNIDDFTLDGGIESVRTVSGDDNGDDYIAPRISFTYLQKDWYKLTGRAEMRFGDDDTESVFTLGGTVKLGQDYTLLSRARYFDADYRETDLLIGMAFRPVSRDALNHLAKFRWKLREDEYDETKYIGSWHVNYNPRHWLRLMGEYALKYTDASEYGHSFTDLLRGRVIYDINDRFDVGVHAGGLWQHETDTYTLAYGVEGGVKVIENLWVGVGYNFDGFYDEDFDDANYWSRGPYFKIRLKFDEETLKKLYGKIRGEKKEMTAP